MVTAVPPRVGPLFGFTLLTVGGANVGKSVGQAAALPARMVTVTVTAPALPAGVVAVIVVLLTTTTLVAALLPNITVAPATKSAPVIVTAVPPAIGPLFGLTLATKGTVLTVAARKVTICISHGPELIKGAQE